MTYRIVLFLHVAGAIATFIGVAGWFFAVVAMRRVQRTSEVSSLAWIYEMAGVIGLTGILVVAASGLYMAATVWGLSRDWVLVAIAAFAFMAPVGPLMVSPRIELVIQLARKSGEGPPPAELAARQKDPIPKLGLLAVIGDLVGIVFIMTFKPGLVGSVAAVLVGVAFFELLGLPAIGKSLSAAVDAVARLERNNPLYRR